MVIHFRIVLAVLFFIFWAWFLEEMPVLVFFFNSGRTAT